MPPRCGREASHGTVADLWHAHLRLKLWDVLGLSGKSPLIQNYVAEAVKRHP